MLTETQEIRKIKKLPVKVFDFLLVPVLLLFLFLFFFFKIKLYLFFCEEVCKYVLFFVKVLFLFMARHLRIPLHTQSRIHSCFCTSALIKWKIKEHANLLLFNYCQLIKLHCQAANRQFKIAANSLPVQVVGSAAAKLTKVKLAYTCSSGNVTAKLTKIQIAQL